MTRSAKGVTRLVLFLVLWLVLVVAGVAWAVRVAGVPLGELRRLLALPAPTILVLLGLFVALYLSDVYRYRLLGEAVGVAVGFRAALDASIANYFFGWLTPGGAFGAPGAIVVLARRGVPWNAAVVIAFAKSITGTAFLLVLAFLALAAGLGPDFSTEIRWVLATGSAVVVLTMAVPMVAAFFPRRSVALIDRLAARLGGRPGSWRSRAVGVATRGLRQAVERLERLRAGGVAMAARLALAHLAFFAAFIGVAVVLAMTFGADAGRRGAFGSGLGRLLRR
ncbi:MAG TPA: lysylphosphatidylglycerol synthase domain-containing protein, partial [Thermoanaerobaculia bacterium]|nr:lysylphosphatidylglycerol synthase domain-containing protein [Thermoanaerobaculia bacterium]